MTGYVQRLVASTRAVRPAIRPTFGPGFGDLLHEGGPQVLPELETEETVLSRPAASASGSYPQTQPPVGPESEPATTSAAPLFPNHAATTPTALSLNNPPELVARFPPEVAQRSDTARLAVVPPAQVQPHAETKQPAETKQKVSGDRGLAVKPGHPDPAGGDLEPRPDLTFESPEPPQEFQPSPRSSQVEQAVARESYQPVMSKNLQPPQGHRVEEMSPWNAHVPRVGIPDRLHVGTQPERPAEEIQIHIGRIEVTAITPPPVRPPAPLVRKAIRLEEYLRRGRGNA